jgi:hypothetical protein
MCHSKQSVIKQYAISNKASDLRPVIQQYNMKKAEEDEKFVAKMDEQNQQKWQVVMADSTKAFCDQSPNPLNDPMSINQQLQQQQHGNHRSTHQPSQQPQQQNRWAQFLDEKELAEFEERESDDDDNNNNKGNDPRFVTRPAARGQGARARGDKRTSITAVSRTSKSVANRTNDSNLEAPASKRRKVAAKVIADGEEDSDTRSLHPPVQQRSTTTARTSIAIVHPQDNDDDDDDDDDPRFVTSMSGGRYETVYEEEIL